MLKPGTSNCGCTSDRLFKEVTEGLGRGHPPKKARTQQCMLSSHHGEVDRQEDPFDSLTNQPEVHSLAPPV